MKNLKLILHIGLPINIKTPYCLIVGNKMVRMILTI